MLSFRHVLFTSLFSVSMVTVHASAHDAQFDRGLSALQTMAGCYLIDYSYTETEALQENYKRDTRVYDVNTNKSIKEWIYPERVDAHRIRLQHILFGTNLDGEFMEGSLLRHQAEDWEYHASFLYDFTGPLTWAVKKLAVESGEWVRKITNLDDGLRYQCAAAWNMGTAYPEWSCENYSPIPGRETRDMSRKDYNALQRNTRIVAYGSSWLERQSNTKIQDKQGVRTPLAKELGKNWYVKLPDTECAPAQEFAKKGNEFWIVLREAWDEVLDGKSPFVERAPAPGQSSRYGKILAVEEEYSTQNLKSASVRAAAKVAIQKVIQEHRQ